VAAAWASPLLTSSPAYAYGVSSCPSNRVCGSPTELQVCCPGDIGTGPNQYNCTHDELGNLGCVLNGTPGGLCGNNGQGQSSCLGSVHCNGNSSSNSCTCGSYPYNTCGGYGSQCSADTDCQSNYVCIGTNQSKFCTPKCTTSGGCTQTSKATTCQVLGTNMVCRQACTGKNDCPSNSSGCTDGFCL
jgi:hypothetical protein